MCNEYANTIIAPKCRQCTRLYTDRVLISRAGITNLQIFNIEYELIASPLNPVYLTLRKNKKGEIRGLDVPLSLVDLGVRDLQQRFPCSSY